MSRVGKQPIPLPSGVECKADGFEVHVKGPKGELSQRIHPDMNVKTSDGTVTVERPSDARLHRSLHGLTRQLVANMVQGVSAGFEKNLEIVGVGYRAELAGKRLVLMLGYSHPIVVEAPDGVQFEVEGNNKIKVAGIDKQVVGEMAARIRALRKPEPYKGKGIRYAGEFVRRKAGKTAA
jgi:large subunit ribosomal protein L6